MTLMAYVNPAAAVVGGRGLAGIAGIWGQNAVGGQARILSRSGSVKARLGRGTGRNRFEREGDLGKPLAYQF
jgi:hypothetical protein